MVTLATCTLGIVASCVRRSLAQRHRVLKIAGFNSTIVSYSGDVQWDRQGNRYRTIGSKPQQTAIRQWILQNFAIDFIESPVAIEFRYGDSTLTSDVIEEINQLPSVRQIWIHQWPDNLSNVTTNEDLKRLFPNLIVAPPDSLPRSK